MYFGFNFNLKIVILYVPTFSAAKVLEDIDAPVLTCV